MLRHPVRKGPLVLAVGLVALIGAACNPTVWTAPVAGSGGPACPVGTYTLDHTTVVSTLDTPIGPVTVSVDPGSVTLDVTEPAPVWTLSGDLHLTVNGSTPWGAVNGAIDLDGSAAGAYTVSSGRITFSVGSISGTATFNGTVGGLAVNQSFDLASVDQLTSLYGLSGSVPYYCPTAGGVTLSFPSFVHSFVD